MEKDLKEYVEYVKNSNKAFEQVNQFITQNFNVIDKELDYDKQDFSYLIKDVICIDVITDKVNEFLSANGFGNYEFVVVEGCTKVLFLFEYIEFQCYLKEKDTDGWRRDYSIKDME